MFELICYFGDAHNRIDAGIPPWCPAAIFVPLSAVSGPFAEVMEGEHNAQLRDGEKYQWIKLDLEQMRQAYAAHEKAANGSAQPVRQGHPTECACGPCKREARENRAFLRAYIGAQ